MFTGIVEELGTVDRVEADDGHARLWIRCAQVLDDASAGDSIAVDGCCLTVDALDLGAGRWAADLMAETRRATTLGGLAAGDVVDLERAMTPSTRFGGHLVQGHVDGVGTVVDRAEQPGTVFLTFHAPAEVARYLVPKGSVTVQGASLTVVDVVDQPDGGARFRVGLVPHTLDATVLGRLDVQDSVNLEADVVAKYVERLVAPGTTSSSTPPRSTPTTD